MGLTRLQPGGCCGCSCPLYPCTLSAPTLTFKADYSTSTPPGIYTCTLTNTSTCTWTGCLFAGGPYYAVTVRLSGTCSLYMIQGTNTGCTLAPTGTKRGYDNAAGCSGNTFSPRWTLTSFTCSPLNIQFTENNLGLISQYYITP